MKVLFDTNIVLDLLLDRKPYTVKAQQLFAMVETNVINGVLGATTITTIDYLVTRAMDRHHAQTAIIRLLKLFEIAPVNRVILENALVIKFHD